MLLFQSLLDTEGGDESASQSPLSTRTRRYQLTPRHSERTIPATSSADITPHHKIHHSKSIPSKFHISGIGNCILIYARYTHCYLTCNYLTCCVRGDLVGGLASGSKKKKKEGGPADGGYIEQRRFSVTPVPL